MQLKMSSAHTFTCLSQNEMTTIFPMTFANTMYIIMKEFFSFWFKFMYVTYHCNQQQININSGDGLAMIRP